MMFGRFGSITNPANLVLDMIYNEKEKEEKRKKEIEEKKTKKQKNKLKGGE